MDNYQIPSAQPQVNQPAIGPRPMVQQVQVVPKSKNNIDLIKTIVIVILSLMTVTFLGLFIWMLVQYNDASSDVDGQIAVAVAAAKDEQAKKLEAEFQAREKKSL